MSPEGEAASALPEDQTKQQMLDVYKPAMRDLVRESILLANDSERLAQLRVARRNHLYYEGKQNLAPAWIIPGEFADYVPVSTSRSGDPDREEVQRQFDVVFNFTRSDTAKAVSITGKAPSVRAVPDDPNTPDSLQAAKDANAVAHYWRQRWRPDQLQKKLMFYFEIYGPVFAYVRWVADRRKYGVITIPTFESQDVPLEGTAGYHCHHCGQFTPTDLPSPVTLSCPSCQSPMPEYLWKPNETVPVLRQTGETEYAAGGVECSLETTLTVLVPSDIDSLDETPYLHYERELHKARILSMHPELASRLEELDSTRGAWFDSSSGPETRAISKSTDASGSVWRRDQWSYALTWLRPSMYWLLKDKRLRAGLQQQFPDGIRLTWVCDELIDMMPENLSTTWCAVAPMVGNRLLQDPLVNDSIPLSDLYNDSQNLLHQTAQRGIPATLVDSKVFDVEAFAKRPSHPQELIAVPFAGRDPGSLVAKLPTADFPQHIVPWLEGIREAQRDIIGIPKAISGVEGRAMTAEEARLRQNAALRQRSVPYDNTRIFWCDMMKLAVLQTAKYGIGQLVAPAKRGVFGQQTQVVDISRLSPYGFHFEADEGMPGNYAEERDRVLTYLQESPQIAETIGLTHPINAEAMASYLRIEGIINPAENLKSKVRWQIDQLLKAEPIPGPDGKMQPSIQPDEWDPHDVVANLCWAWLDSPEGIDARESGSPGFDNVVAFAKAHQAMAMAMAPPTEGGAPSANNAEPMPPPAPPDQSMPLLAPIDTGPSPTDFVAPELTQAPQATPIQ